MDTDEEQSIDTALNDAALERTRVEIMSPTVSQRVTRSTSPRFSDMQRAWGCLVLAIVLEVLGLIVLKMAASHGWIAGHWVLYFLVGLAYVLLSKAVQTISIGVAYAIWEGSGIALITLVSWIVFEDVLSFKEMLGIALAILGILLIHAGQMHPVTSVTKSNP